MMKPNVQTSVLLLRCCDDNDLSLTDVYFTMNNYFYIYFNDNFCIFKSRLLITQFFLFLDLYLFHVCGLVKFFFFVKFGYYFSF